MEVTRSRAAKRRSSSSPSSSNSNLGFWGNELPVHKTKSALSANMSFMKDMAEATSNGGESHRGSPNGPDGAVNGDISRRCSKRPEFQQTLKNK